ncbi:hypothetical protein PGT21_018831 [Puccinia graminis f. sp. tritici]|uniref:Uncharacterized protein n=1 Tax=Puccinia graminis f. sp. tritici TaxID=56615 RepID=A0A5B0QNS3_PUCGR|nr:hypothetical protein PGT21_018831 [Puccinia graminis f. sp. tritici]
MYPITSSQITNSPNYSFAMSDLAAVIADSRVPEGWEQPPWTDIGGKVKQHIFKYVHC